MPAPLRGGARGVRAELRVGRRPGAAVSFVLDGETVVDLWGGWIDPEHRASGSATRS